MIKISLIFLSLFLVSCGGGLHQPAASVSSSETIRIAESYLRHRWQGQQQNVKHGLDTDGILVNTPDVNLKNDQTNKGGWWKVGSVNTGIPYKWGGFDTPVSFDEKLARGLAAGDIYTSAKRQALYDGESKFAAGVDCSGLVSRCWRLSKHYSTRDLPGVSRQLASFDQLQAGDIVSKYNTHVMLFYRFVGKDKKHFIAYDTGGPGAWAVKQRIISTSGIKNLGYQPYRYNNLVLD